MAQLVPPPTAVKLTANGAQPGDNFGSSVAYSHGRIAVGAPGRDHASGSDAGAVYCFTLNGSTWVQEPPLYTTSVSAGAEFGRAIAMSEDLLVVGAWHDLRGGGPAAGTAWVYARGTNSWGSPVRLPSSSHMGDEFGASVAVHGNWIAVGAPSSPYGSVHLFERHLGTWRFVEKLVSFAPTGPGERFGWSVAFSGVDSGDVLAVGAPSRWGAGGVADVGAVYLFAKDPGAWRPARFLLGQQHIIGGALYGARFGRALGAARHSVLVSSDRGVSFFTDVLAGTWRLSGRESLGGVDSPALPSTDVAMAPRAALRGWRRANADRGWVEQFDRTDPGRFVHRGLLYASDAAVGDQFGSAVALDGNSFVVGAPTDDHAGGVNAGSVYAFRGATPQEAWITLHPGGVGSPPARSNHALAADLFRRRVVLFGGAADQSGSLNFFNDTWEWNGVHWILRSPAHRPPARAQHAMAFDPARRRTVLFGGKTTGLIYDDMWEWDGNDWLQISNSASISPPPALFAHGLAFDEYRRRLVLHGGATYGSTLNSPVDTWEWQSTGTGTGLWTRNTNSPGAGPGIRIEVQLAYDAARRQTLLHAGRNAVGQMLGETWRWNGSAWLRLDSSGPFGNYPLGSGGPALGFDRVTGDVVLSMPAAPLTWRWNGAAWNSAAADNGLRRYSPMAWDPSRGLLLRFGGIDRDSVPGTSIYLSDTVSWSGFAE
ncbi:MAG: hypothetical protein IPJ77_11165 [Planctomycetes bacterium]|nr:hypothetical protein [Planctomycetota bacterium]